jgi:hypothetical protein
MQLGPLDCSWSTFTVSRVGLDVSSHAAVEVNGRLWGPPGAGKGTESIWDTIFTDTETFAQWENNTLTRPLPDLSRRHHLHTFTWKLWRRWKFFRIDHLSNVSIFHTIVKLTLQNPKWWHKELSVLRDVNVPFKHHYTNNPSDLFCTLLE